MPDQMYDQVKQLADLNNPPVKKGSAVGTLVVMAIFLAGLGVAGYAGYDWWKGRTPTAVTRTTTTPTPTTVGTTTAPTSSPSLSPTAIPNNTSSTINIQVLNGTGVAGVASKVKDMLTAAGYTSVTTGNAQAYEYESTVIMAKPAVQASVPALQTLLSKTYTLDNQKNNLDASNPYDVVIIVGKN